MPLLPKTHSQPGTTPVVEDDPTGRIALENELKSLEGEFLLKYTGKTPPCTLHEMAEYNTIATLIAETIATLIPQTESERKRGELSQRLARYKRLKSFNMDRIDQHLKSELKQISDGLITTFATMICDSLEPIVSQLETVHLTLTKDGIPAHHINFEKLLFNVGSVMLICAVKLGNKKSELDGESTSKLNALYSRCNTIINQYQSTTFPLMAMPIAVVAKMVKEKATLSQVVHYICDVAQYLPDLSAPKFVLTLIESSNLTKQSPKSTTELKGWIEVSDRMKQSVVGQNTRKTLPPGLIDRLSVFTFNKVTSETRTQGVRSTIELIQYGLEKLDALTPADVAESETETPHPSIKVYRDHCRSLLEFNLARCQAYRLGNSNVLMQDAHQSRAELLALLPCLLSGVGLPSIDTGAAMIGICETLSRAEAPEDLLGQIESMYKHPEHKKKYLQIKDFEIFQHLKIGAIDSAKEDLFKQLNLIGECVKRDDPLLPEMPHFKLNKLEDITAPTLLKLSKDAPRAALNLLMLCAATINTTEDEELKKHLTQNMGLGLQMVSRKNEYWVQFGPLFANQLLDLLWALISTGPELAQHCTPILEQCQSCYPGSHYVVQTEIALLYQQGHTDKSRQALATLTQTHPALAYYSLISLCELPAPPLPRKKATVQSILEHIEKHNWATVAAIICQRKVGCPTELEEVPKALIDFIAELAPQLTLPFIRQLPFTLRAATLEQITAITPLSPALTEDEQRILCAPSLNPREQSEAQLVAATKEQLDWGVFTNDGKTAKNWEAEIAKTIAMIKETPRKHTATEDKGPIYELLARLQDLALSVFDTLDGSPETRVATQWCLSMYNGLELAYAAQFSNQKSPEILVMKAQILEDMPDKSQTARKCYQDAIILIDKSKGQNTHKEAFELAKSKLKHFNSRTLTPHWLRQ